MNLITGKTKLLGIIGDPIEHSLSPVMHNAAIAKLGLDYVYIPFPVKEENLEVALEGFKAIDLVGFNITIPHKQSIIPFLTEVQPAAKVIGAVNTVWRTEKGWSGTNTDLLGFIAPLKKLDRDWNSLNPLVLGHGGAARAVIAGLSSLGCLQINVVGRNPDKLARFYQSWQAAQEISSSLKIHYWDNLASLIQETKLLINTTPVGMSPHTNQSPVSSELMATLSSDAIAYDLIYTPSPTRFLQLAQQQGAMVIDGLEMLVQQGAAALEIWLQQSVPVQTMEQSLLNALGL